MSMHGIIGPFFFEIDGETATINSKRYVAVVDRFWRSLGETFGQAFFKTNGSSMVARVSMFLASLWTGLGGTLLRESSADILTVPGVRIVRI